MQDQPTVSPIQDVEATTREQDGSKAKKEKEDKYQLSLEGMLKAGVHFGHKKSRRNPKMDPYIFGTRNNINIIDLEKTLDLFREALNFIEEIVQKKGTILLVGTKKQAKGAVRAVAEKAEIPYVNERWLGGTFTNFSNISKRIKYLIDQKEALEKGRLADYTKLERLKLEKALNKLEEKMGGLKRMTKIPDAVFVLDIKKDNLAVKEARQKGVKVIGLVDTNCDPTEVDYPIPANDDALSSLKYILGVFLRRILEVKKADSMEVDTSPTEKRTETKGEKKKDS